MGNKAAPTLSCLTIGYLEEKLYNTLENQYGTAYSNYIRNVLKRFIDDCFVLWKRMYGDIMVLFNTMNSMNSQIQYTIEIQQREIPFLDVLVIKNGTSLQTDVYFKQTDTHNYLPFHSCHPRGTKHNIPYNLALRLQMLVSDTKQREVRFQELRTLLIAKGYPENLIANGINQAKQHSRESLLQEKEKSDMQDIVTYSTIHNPNNAQISNIIKDTYRGIQSTTSLQRSFNNRRIILANRRSQNIKELVTRAAYYNSNTDTTKCSIKKCGKKCVTCSHLVETSEVKFKTSDEPFMLKHNFSCNSRNLIYLIVCECMDHFIQSHV